MNTYIMPASANDMRLPLHKPFPKVAALLALLVLVPANTASAQLFGPESLGGAVLGGIAGGVIGHNNGRRTAEGAAIGAGAGAILGAIVGNERRTASASGWDSEPRHFHEPNRALSGAVIGGVAGGIIGHNNGRRTAEGIAIGAGAGLLLGTLADQQAARRQALWHPTPVYHIASISPSPTPEATPSHAPPVSSEPILLRPIGGAAGPAPMAGANALFGR
jgi:outer membrane lipoprotein SlyB